MDKELEGILRGEIEGLSAHVIELRRAIRQSLEALGNNLEHDAIDILEPFSDL